MGIFGKKQPEIVEPPLRFFTKTPLPALDPVIYAQVKWLVFNAITAHAQDLVLNATQQGVKVQYVIDAVTHDAPSVDPSLAVSMMAILKVHAGIDPSQPKPLASGEFQVHIPKKKITGKLVSQLGRGTERLVVNLDEGKPPPDKFEDTGMRPKMLEQIRETLKKPGIFVVSAPPQQGFTTSFNCMIRCIDRYLHNVVTVEDKYTEEKQIENAPITTYDPKAGESPVAVLPRLLRTYPDVVCVRNVVDTETMTLLCDQPRHERVVVIGVQALDAIEALPRVLAYKGPRDKFAQNVTGVLNQRLIRKLCEHCKQAYPPPPPLLQKLGVPPGRIQAFYRPGPPPAPPTPPGAKEPIPPPAVCPQCNGIGYLGRTAIFELLIVNDALRQTLATSNKLDDLRRVAKESGHNTLMEEGVVACALGVTSMEELLRIMKLTGG
ncbi:MAG: Flp pilus assembly complex ATPase component TadA [Planctomycetia bacterium]|nr:Flp pilus assembly complex ATPase component TadA [Planctomycetia bacterium]